MPPQNNFNQKVGRPKKKSLQEVLTESHQAKIERLKDLTGILSDEELGEIFYEIAETVKAIGLENISYELNTYDDRGGSEKQFAFKNLNDEELDELENVLKKLRVFGFPENIPDSNLVNLIIENRRDLEVLRLLSVSEYIREKKRFEMEERERKAAEEERKREEKELEDALRVGVEQAVLAYKRRIAKSGRNPSPEDLAAKRRQLEKELVDKWDREKVGLKKESKIKKDTYFKNIADFLGGIEPQKIDIDDEILNRTSPYYEVSGFMGYLPKSFDSKTSRKKMKAEDLKHRQEVDPIPTDEQIAYMDELWKSGIILEEIENEQKNIPRNFYPNMNIFPDKYRWRYDKKTRGKKLFEYNKETDSLGKEVTKQEREQVFLRLSELRKTRIKKEAEENRSLPKTKEEKQLEEKLILFLNNLILWQMRRLIDNYIKGNREVRKVEVEDLYQNAQLGIIRALEKQDEEMKNAETSISYILAYTEGHMRRLYDVERGINFSPYSLRLPSHRRDERNRVERIIHLLKREFPDRKIRDEEIAVALSKPGIGILPEINEKDKYDKKTIDNRVGLYKQLREELFMDYSEVAYEAIIDDEKEVDTRVDMLAQALHQEANYGEKVQQENLERDINRTLLELTPREERVIRLRFGITPLEAVRKKIFGKARNINGNIQEGMTFEEIGDMYGYNRERIGQIEVKALRKLKHPSRNRLLREHRGDKADWQWK